MNSGKRKQCSEWPLGTTFEQTLSLVRDHTSLTWLSASVFMFKHPTLNESVLSKPLHWWINTTGNVLLILSLLHSYGTWSDVAATWTLTRVPFNITSCARSNNSHVRTTKLSITQRFIYIFRTKTSSRCTMIEVINFAIFYTFSMSFYSCNKDIVTWRGLGKRHVGWPSEKLSDYRHIPMRTNVCLWA